MSHVPEGDASSADFLDDLISDYVVTNKLEASNGVCTESFAEVSPADVIIDAGKPEVVSVAAEKVSVITLNEDNKVEFVAAVPIVHTPAENKDVQRRSEQCSEHPMEAVRMYCSDCEAAVCVKCFFQTHKDHVVEDVDEASGKIREKLNAVVDRISNHKANRTVSATRSHTSDDELSGILHKIDEQAARLQAKIEVDVNELRLEMERMTQQKRQRQEQKISAEVEIQTQLSRFLNECQTLVREGRPVDLLAEYKQLNESAAQLETRLQESVNDDEQENNEDNIQFITVNIEDCLPLGRTNALGTIVHNQDELNNLKAQLSFKQLEAELRRERDQKAELKREIMSLARSHAVQTAQIEEEWRDQLTRATNELSLQLETTTTRHEYEMAKLKEEFSIQLKQAQSVSTNAVPSSPLSDEITRIAQDHASEQLRADTRIAHLETLLAECKKTISEMTAEHNKKMDKVQSDYKRDINQLKQEQERQLKESNSSAVSLAAQSDINSVYELNKEVISSPVVKVTALKSPLVKSPARKISASASLDTEEKLSRQQSSDAKSPKLISVKASDSSAGPPTKISVESSLQRTPSFKPPTDTAVETSAEEQKSPTRKLRSNAEANPNFSCNSSEIDAETVNAAYLEVLNDSSSTNWLILGYEDRRIVLVSKGSDYEAFKSSFTDDRGLYGFIRIISGDELSKRPKFVLIMWIGSKVSAPAAAKMTLGKSNVKAVIKHLAIEVQATSVEHLEQDVLLESLKKAGGANYGTGM